MLPHSLGDGFDFPGYWRQPQEGFGALPCEGHEGPWLQPEQPQEGVSERKVRMILRAKNAKAAITMAPTIMVSVMFSLKRLV